MVGNPQAARAHGTNKRMRETILAGKPADPLKQLKVKASVCVRMSNEVAYYQKEAGENETRVQGMKDEGKDIYDVSLRCKMYGHECNRLFYSRHRRRCHHHAG